MCKCKNKKKCRCAPISLPSITISGVSNNSTANLLTTTVSGVTGTAVNIINSNVLSLSTVNLISTINGIDSNSLDITPAFANIAWKLTGNASTVAGTNFLGTTDAIDVVFKANATEAFRIKNSNGYLGIGTNAPTATIHGKGVDATASNYILKLDNVANSPLIYATNAQKVSIGTATLDAALRINRNDVTKPALIIGNPTGTDNWHYVNSVLNTAAWLDMMEGDMTLSTNYRILHSMQTGGIYELYYNGSGATRLELDTRVNQNRIIAKTDSNNYTFQVYPDGKIGMASLPVGNAGLVTGDLYQDTAANILANGDLVVGIKQ